MPASDDDGGLLQDWEGDIMLREQRLVGLELVRSIASGSGPASSQGEGAQGGKKFEKSH